MARIDAAVFDAGPLIHLKEIGALGTLALFTKVVLSGQVRDELLDFSLPKNCAVVELDGRAKDMAKIVAESLGLGLGEASAIALAKQKRVRLFFTDDLGARDAAKRFNLEPHGTLAIITRAYRENLSSKAEAISFLEKIHSGSSLYVTTDLVAWARKQIESYGQ
ncbi:hypothetical protein HY995_06020 [Candidatus Micrarchaeota archaeon]|nr:hypothetical protein [Candidatus Micrarchaeota archaeon]